MAIMRVLTLRNFSQVKGLGKLYSLKKIALVNGRSLTIQNHNKPPKEDTVYEESIKEKILEASLPFVKKRGWSTAAISDGAVSLGYPGIINGVFSNPRAELIDYFNKKCNCKLSEYMAATVNESEGSLPPEKFIENAVQYRLKMLIPYIGNWHEALAIMAIPSNLPFCARTSCSLIDDICYYAGDRSVDFNWYSRRFGVHLVYITTESYMLQDKSQDFTETWKFLERRIGNLTTINKTSATGEKIVENLGEITSATFTTLRNILRL